MHLQGGLRLAVVADLEFAVHPGECVVLAGPSGIGKSSVLKMIFGGYRCDRGTIIVRHGTTAVNVAAASPRQILSLRRRAIGYVSQFLRALPRVPALDVVANSLVGCGEGRETARCRAIDMLRFLKIPGTLWGLPPATFSGGEQQRVNIARGLLPDLPILLLDEPTASLDAANRERVIDLIAEKKRRGTAIVAIVHDEDVRASIADSVVNVSHFASGQEGR